MAAVHFYTDSIYNKCKYFTYPCNSESDFNKGLCIKCSGNGCNRMGYWASPSNDLGGVFLDTKPTTENVERYCLQNFGVTLHSKADKQNSAKGDFKIQFESADGIKSTNYLLDGKHKYFEKGSIEKSLISLSTHFNYDIDRIHVSYTRENNILWLWSSYDDKWAFDFIFLTIGQTQTTYKFCPTTTYIQSGKSVPFIHC